MFECERVRDTSSRWLAGGSVWDIAFMFRISVSTIQATKYITCKCINEVLKDNITFPTSEEGLACLAAGFARISKWRVACGVWRVACGVWRVAWCQVCAIGDRI
jgi:hypothetical protein